MNTCRCKESLFWQSSRVADHYVSILISGFLVHLTIGPLPHVHDSVSELLQQWKSSLNLKAFLLNSMFWENSWSLILVRVSARFELARVRVIGSQLYITIIQFFFSFPLSFVPVYHHLTSASCMQNLCTKSCPQKQVTSRISCYSRVQRF